MVSALFPAEQDFGVEIIGGVQVSGLGSQKHMVSLDIRMRGQQPVWDARQCRGDSHPGSRSGAAQEGGRRSQNQFACHLVWASMWPASFSSPL